MSLLPVLFFSLCAALLAALLTWRLPPERFRRLAGWTALGAALGLGALLQAG